ncbi:unnamed protein product [Colias eurytheme]|nr:unnamed protein product [Colias eurytheme]
MSNVCAGCHNTVKGTHSLRCSLCSSVYDLQCAGTSDKRFIAMLPEKKSSWKCPACLNLRPKLDNTNTPIRNILKEPVCDDLSSHVADSNITLRNKMGGSSRSRPNASDDSNPVTEASLQKILDSFKSDMTEVIQNAVTKAVCDKFSTLTKQISDFHESLTFLNDQYEALKLHVKENDNIMTNLTKENATLVITVKDLTSRLAYTEQHLRESNLEINGIPENRSENLSNCLNQLAKVVNADIKDDDIMQVTRIAKINKDDGRPRAVVAKLRSPRHRDILLAAVQKYNKCNSDDKLSTHHLGIGGTNKPVYVAEHLTPANKILHATARLKAKETNYKFVWVRNGKIFVRKNETSQALQIRCLDSIKKMV